MSARELKPPPGTRAYVRPQVVLSVPVTNGIAAAVEAKPDFRFKLVAFNDIELTTDCRYLIRDIIPSEGLTVVWGPPKCGKSFWLYDALLHVACGWEYRGRAVASGAVVYVACEGDRGFQARSAAYRQNRLDTFEGPVPFYLVTTRLTLRDDHPELIAAIKAQLGSVVPVAIAIDTLNKSLGGSENNDEDMGAYVQAAEAVRESFHCAVVVVHHCGIDGTRPRGHTSLAGAADAQIAVKRDAEGTILTTVEFLKDGEQGAELASRLEPVTVGQDVTGTDITSCLVSATEPIEPSQKKTGAKLPAGAAACWKAVQRAVEADGQQPPPGYKDIPGFAKVVHVDLVRRLAKQFEISRGDDNATLKAVHRGIQTLADKGFIGHCDGWVWLNGVTTL
jgi:hypothetical protein